MRCLIDAKIPLAHEIKEINSDRLEITSSMVLMNTLAFTLQLRTSILTRNSQTFAGIPLQIQPEFFFPHDT